MYPGVYIDEVPSGIRTITGIATAITATIGRAPRGPVNLPTRVQNFGDYTRAFGGLSLDSTMSFAVEQFFNNGGTDAVIVRVYEPPSSGNGVGSVVPAADTRAGTTVPETQATITRAINRTGSTGFKASTMAETHVTVAVRWVSDKLLITANADGTSGNAIATTSTFTDPANSFDDATLSGEWAPAQGTLSIASQPAADGTFTINTREYTFDANGALDDTTADRIEIRLTIAKARQNVINAINRDGTPGTGYSTPTKPNVDVDAAAGTIPAAIILTAKTPAPGGNTIAAEEMMAAVPPSALHLQESPDHDRWARRPEGEGLAGREERP
jgi:hypothetical protein